MTFIVGMGRSGTTMLTNMLNSNLNIIACPENEFVLYAYTDYKDKDFNDEETINHFINLFDGKFSKIISFWKPGNQLADFITKLKSKTYANVCKQVYLSYPFAQKDIDLVTCIVDKNPIYSLYLDELNSIFPNSKYIVLTRDFRDNAISRKKYSDKKTSLYTLGASWNYYYKKIFKSIHKNNLSYYLLRYEDLAENPSSTLQELCNFLQIEYSENMLHFQELAKDIKKYVKENLDEKDFQKLNTMHSNLEKTISKDRIEAYKNELTAEEIEILNTICYKHGKEFNYITNKTNKQSAIIHFNLILSNVKVRMYYFLHKYLLKLPIKYRLYFKL